MANITIKEPKSILPPAIQEKVLLEGDLSKLTPPERLSFYKAVCESLGLNPLTQPFEYIVLKGKLKFYAKRDCTDQLRKLHQVSVTMMSHKEVEGVQVVTVSVMDRHGRTDMSTGAVPIAGLKGEEFANALMKAETKAKRRATLSICGLGVLDETEVETITDEPLNAARSANQQRIDQLREGATTTTPGVGASVGADQTPAPSTLFEK